MADPVIDLIKRVYSDTPRRHGARWVMNRSWYDRVRAAASTEEDEQARARGHAKILAVAAVTPGRCPACGAGPFAGMEAFTAHVMAQADPRNRAPDPGDELLGLPIEVREDGGQPHLAAPAR